MLTVTREAAPAVRITSGTLWFFALLDMQNYQWIVAKESHLTEGEEERKNGEAH